MDIIDELQNWVTDWDGSAMKPGESPRDGIHCDVLYKAIAEIKRLRGVTDDNV